MSTVDEATASCVLAVELMLEGPMPGPEAGQRWT
jgi:hypothetical protein